MFEQILNTIDDVVWGIPTIALILVTGIVMTIATRGIQFTKLGRAFKSIFKGVYLRHTATSLFGTII